jgi:hypothetical protein
MQHHKRYCSGSERVARSSSTVIGLCHSTMVLTGDSVSMLSYVNDTGLNTPMTEAVLRADYDFKCADIGSSPITVQVVNAIQK